MRHPPADLIRKKRDAEQLDEDEVEDLVAGVLDGSLSDSQLGALLMAGTLRGASVAETIAWTEAMMRSGKVLDLSGIPGPKVDKHSTGGVGDKVSIPLAPLVAACGVVVPMVSGRGLGHTGGTVDKLESIPGFRTQLSSEEFVAILARVGVAMSAATAEIAPADRKMYAARDVTATVESIPWITSSILSKKLAEGIDGLVLDVKCGRGAFMAERQRAESLLSALVGVGRGLGKRVAALLTSMDDPLGRAVGNVLEIRESIDCLSGTGPEDLHQVVLALGAEMLLLAGIAASPDDARARLEAALGSGAALEKFRQLVAAQGGDPRITEEKGALPRAGVVRLVTSPRSGVLAAVDALAIGRCAMALGAGRVQAADRVNPSAGVVLLRVAGERVERGDPLAEVHGDAKAKVDEVSRAILAAFSIGDAAAPGFSPVLLRVGPDDAPPVRDDWLI